MSSKRSHKKNLSKAILDMKFMKKSKEKLQQERDEEEGSQFFGADATKGSKFDGTQYITEHSMVSIESLLCGRMSFRGMNPEVERLMLIERQDIIEQEKALQRFKSNQPEISDTEMARRLGKTVAKKFNSKNGNDDTEDSDEEGIDSDDPESSPPKKAKFMKPADD